jgi:hypothetical protein
MWYLLTLECPYCHGHNSSWVLLGLSCMQFIWINWPSFSKLQSKIHTTSINLFSNLEFQYAIVIWISKTSGTMTDGARFDWSLTHNILQRQNSSITRPTWRDSWCEREVYRNSIQKHFYEKWGKNLFRAYLFYLVIISQN